MTRHFKKMVFVVLAGTIVLAISCKKPGGGSPSNNNNTGNVNTSAPSLAVYQPGEDTTVGINASLTIKIEATASSTANIDSILGTDGLGNTFRVVCGGLAKGAKVSETKDTLVYNYYQLPTSATGTTVSLTYTVYGKGQSNSITRHITVHSPPVFNIWTVTIYDQSQGGNQAFLNTGGNPQYLYYSTGNLNSDTADRRLVDMCCAQTAGQTDMVFSPGYESTSYSPSFADSNIFNINNGWLPSQKRITLFRKLLPKYVVSSTNTNFTTYAEVEAAYKGATTPAMPRVQNPFSPNDNYAFLTEDGRYGVFTLLTFGGGAKMSMALESR